MARLSVGSNGRARRERVVTQAFEGAVLMRELEVRQSDFRSVRFPTLEWDD
jgi:hypothetical protein